MGEYGLAFGVPGGSGSAALAFALVAALVVLGFRELRHEPSVRRRRILGGARLASALMALFLVLQPRLSGERFIEEEGRRVLLIDGSRSMTIASGEGTRAGRAAELLERWAGSELERPPTFVFGGDLRSSSLEEVASSYPTRWDETRLLESIERLVGGRLDEEGLDDLGAVILVSDGVDTQGGASLEALAGHGIKVHSVAVGAGDHVRDQSIAQLEADPIAFLRQEAQVRIVLRSSGGDDPLLPVRLSLGDEVLEERLVEVPSDEEVELQLSFSPSRLGRAVYRLSIPVAPGDIVPENNERAFLVRVVRDKLRVLLVAGEPSWDVRFLRAFLKRDPSIDLISFFILRNSADLTMASPEELALIPFPTDELFREHLGSFDVVIFQNFDYGPYQMASYLPRIRDYVLRGGSFAMVGGDRSFGPGGYATTPIAELLPVVLTPPNAPETRALITDRFRPQLVEEEALHPALALLPDRAASLQAWAALAPLEGANVVLGVRPGARVLLRHPSRRLPTGEGLPLLVVGEAGQGRVLTLGIDTSWRWGMTTGGASGDASAYERFWDRCLRWLARDPSLEPARVTTDRERYGPGAVIRVEGLLRDAHYEPLVDRPAELAILDELGQVRASVEVRADARGRVQSELSGPEEPGAYRLALRVQGQEPALAEEGFVVEAGGDELADPEPGSELLEALSGATGGAYFGSPEQAPALEAFDATRTRSLGLVERAPFATLAAFLFAVLLFGVEWWLRRRWGRR